MAKKRFPWARLWVGVATVVALVLMASFIFNYLGMNPLGALE